MNFKGFPYVSSYQSYFSYEANLNLFDPIISNNTEEQITIKPVCWIAYSCRAFSNLINMFESFLYILIKSIKT